MSDSQSKALGQAAEPLPEGGAFGNPPKERRDPRFRELDKLIAKDKAAQAVHKAKRRRERKAKKRRRPPALPSEYHYEIRRMASEHRQRFGPLFETDPDLRENAARLYRSLLPKRKVGQPRHDDITEAMRLEAQGVPRREIYQRLGKTSKTARKNLAQAIRQRRSRSRTRDKARQSVVTLAPPRQSV